MKLRENINSIETNIESTDSFTIKASAKAFSILSSGLYSDKIRAIIRELSCNAIDSHKEANVSTPIEVHIPTQLDPFFYVKDFGLGMSHENVITTFSTYFESTKTDNNDAIGCLGLGSKSPFSYTDTFIIESIYDNIKRIYVSYIGEDGEPKKPNLISEEECDEHNGFKIQFSVKEKDISEFERKASLVYRPFEQKPKFNKNIEIEKYRFISAFNDVLDRYYHKPMCVQGNIEYPLDKDILGLSPELRQFIEDFPCLLKFEIGEIDISASRESISYDKITIKNITSKIKQERARIIKETQDKINSMTKIQAVNFLYSIRKFRLNHEFLYNGEYIPNSPYVNYKTVTYSMSRMNTSVVRKEIERVMVNESALFIHNDISTNGISRIRQYVMSTHSTVIVVENIKDSKLLFDVEVKLASSLKEKKKSVSTGDFKKSSELEYGKFHNEDIIGDIQYYLPISRKTIVSEIDITKLIDSARHFKLIEGFNDVILVRNAYTKSKAFKQLNLKNLEEEVNRLSVNIERDILMKCCMNDIFFKKDRILRNIDRNEIKEFPDDIKKLVDMSIEGENLSMFNTFITDEIEDECIAMFNSMKEKYSMLKITKNWIYGDEIQILKDYCDLVDSLSHNKE